MTKFLFLFLLAALGLFALLPAGLAAPLLCLAASARGQWVSERPEGYRVLPAVAR